MTATEDRLRVILFQEDGFYFVQCLEYDICAHAEDEEVAKERFLALLTLERNLSIERNNEPFKGIEAAPEEFHDMWEKCLLANQPYSLVESGSEISLAKCA